MNTPSIKNLLATAKLLPKQSLPEQKMNTPKIKELLATARLLAKQCPPEQKEHADKLLNWLQDVHRSELGEKGKPRFRNYLLEDFKHHMVEAGITSGTICEIGGPHNSFAADLPDYDFEFLSLYPDDAGKVLVADATQCEHVEGERFDAIFSVSVFEHISKPWKAAKNLSRLLKPGGICYQAAPFSYFYHGAPADFWRFTPDAMRLIFSDLKPLKSEFYGHNRRRDNRGSEVNAVDRDGGPQFSVDGFGGWRENWYTIYVGQKDEEYRLEQIKRGETQVIINLMKHLISNGKRVNPAVKQVQKILSGIVVNQDHEIVLLDSLPNKESMKGLDYSTEKIKEIWLRRGRDGINVSYARFTMAAKVGL